MCDVHACVMHVWYVWCVHVCSHVSCMWCTCAVCAHMCVMHVCVCAVHMCVHACAYTCVQCVWCAYVWCVHTCVLCMCVQGACVVCAERPCGGAMWKPIAQIVLLAHLREGTPAAGGGQTADVTCGVSVGTFVYLYNQHTVTERHRFKESTRPFCGQVSATV